MKKAGGIIISILSILPCIFIAGAAYPADEKKGCVRREHEEGFGICAPAGWRESIRDENGWRVISWARGRAEITLTGHVREGKQQSGDEPLDVPLKEGRKRIAATDRRSVRGITFRVILEEYTEHKVRMLERLLVARYEDTVAVVGCRAPVSAFAAYRNLFDLVMGSIDFSERRRRIDEDRRKSKTDEATLSEEEIQRAIAEELKKIEELERRGILERIPDEPPPVIPKDKTKK